jgi:sugar phosphate isomerase/epimerase
MVTKIIGLKSSLDQDQLNNKIIKDLKLLELHLYEKDFLDFFKFKEKLLNIHNKHPNLKIMLHAPIMEKQKEYLSLSEYNEDLYYKIYSVCKQLNFVTGFVVHSAYKGKSMEKSISNLNLLRDKYKGIDKYMYIENQTGNFSENKDNWLEYIKIAKISRICFDVCHFTKNYSQEDLEEYLFSLRKYITKIYFHISDNNPKTGNSNPLNLGQGSLDLKRLKEHIDFGIIETFPKDEKIGKEVIEDYYYFLEQ